MLIRLKGGNDGLNTFVPRYEYDLYRSLRPTLHHPETDLIRLNDEFAMPTAMTRLKPLWDNGQMRVINSVGYPDHNLSHFTGADIMASGNNDLDNNGDGWLARYYTLLNPDYIENPATDPPAIKIGGPTSILFNDQDKVDISANFSSAGRLEELVQTGNLYDNTAAPDDCYYGEQVLFLRTIANAASIYSQSIFDAYNRSQTTVEYTSSLGEQLKLVARMIKGGLQTQLYLVTLDGFDTHVGQNRSADHPGLLENLSSAVNDFYTDLGENGDDVLSMTYSEFGRRVSENGVGGTDHGTSLPIMLFGSTLEGSGIHGRNPDLRDLDFAGNLKFGTDFRSIYATLLEHWFCIDADQVDTILGESYPRLTDVGINCLNTTGTNILPGVNSFQHGITSLGGGQYQVNFSLPAAGDCTLELYTISGKRIRSIANRYYHQGAHAESFSIADIQVSLVPMVYVLGLNGQRFAGKFLASSR